MTIRDAVRRCIPSMRRLWSESGQDLVEYAMLMALIAVFAMGAVSTLGQTIDSVMWQAIAAQF